jgi:hypothetical protein
MWAGLFPDNVCLGNIANKLFPWSGFDPNLMGLQKGSPLLSVTERLATHSGKVERIK